MSLSKSQMARDIKMLRSELEGLKALLIPFSKEEMELLSVNQSNKSRKKGMFKLTKGIFDTIYYEPLVAYAIKTYTDTNRLILITTTEDEFVYLIKENITNVYMNDVEAGTLHPNGEFLSVRGNLIAAIDGSDHIPNHAVMIQGKNIGFIANPKFTEKTIPRAFNLIKDMTVDEQSIFLCLTLVNLVEEAQS